MILLLLTLLACSPAAPVHGDRWISLSPVITETLGALDRLDVLVARSEWCTLPSEATALPAVGSALTPDLERIAGLAPTGILVDGSRGTATATLSALSTVTVLPWLTLSEGIESTERLGALVDRPTEAKALADRLRAAQVPAPPGGPRVLLVLTPDPTAGDIWYVKANSVHGSALNAAGARNAIPDDVDGAPSLSIEGLLALNPDRIIVLTTEPTTPALRARIHANWAPLTPLAAVKANRIGVVGGPTILSSGPSILATIDALRAEISVSSP